ncbi:2-aminoethylphosphonate aminotransferase [Candidatus Nitrosacidococcus tergens]|uniref:2-aminoethylphosphonate--pyruvate transaminase n=1 Tax=Candidatus Nitrosacidococcus tergens TaxID=553981 RepID=A0A7G1Q8I4_9GAMM|nr:2-aminoethylphosphonate aminotransferase [Candidatus Nitrosacidococcus tergens]CAB1275217.1 2-aminoethylphosphonate--pyruvate transaminase [Candidatus Nitrosacidococcus tergens]
MILLNPGPVNLSHRVRKAFLGPDLCHRESEFFDLQDEIKKQLLAAYKLNPEKWAAVLLSGSGTAAVEAMISSLVPTQGKLLIIENGIYGERITKIAKIHKIKHITLSHSWGEEINFDQLEQTLKKDPKITHVAVIHHETTTGRLNSLETIGRICQQIGVQLLVDGVSSFGAELISFDHWGISGLAATANKCLHGAPGAAFVIVRRDSFPETPLKRSFYLDLASYCQEQDQRGTPFTPAVQSFYVLHEALQEFTDLGGWHARRSHYRQLGNLVEQEFKQLGIKPLLSRKDSSCVLHSYHLPETLAYQSLHDQLKKRGFIIYAGQGKLNTKIFRVATMGAITIQDMQQFIMAVKKIKFI